MTCVYGNKLTMPFTVVGLLSGGKDSCYNLVECARRGHTIGVLANLQPYGYDARTDNSEEEELDSQCFQTVGSDLVPAIADCMQLPLLRRYTKGKAITTSLDYYYDGSIADRDDDEVEDLYALLEEVCRKYPQVNAVSSGAILSNYQRNRVENVCQRLGLTSLCFLWQRDQQSLLQDMVDDGMKAIMVKIASMGLKVSFLGKTLAQLQGQLLQLVSAVCVCLVASCGSRFPFISISFLFNMFCSVFGDTEGPIRAQCVWRRRGIRNTHPGRTDLQKENSNVCGAVKDMF